MSKFKDVVIDLEVKVGDYFEAYRQGKFKSIKECRQAFLDEVGDYAEPIFDQALEGLDTFIMATDVKRKYFPDKKGEGDGK